MAEVGRLLHPEDREALLAAFPPAYPRVVAPLVALEGAGPPAFPLPTEAEGFVVGVADGGDGAGERAGLRPGQGLGRVAPRRVGPGARFVPLESRNHILLEGEPAWGRFLAEVRDFLSTNDP